MNKIKNLLFVFAFVCIVGWGPFSFFSNTATNSPTNASITISANDWLASETRSINSQASNLSPEAVKAGLTAYQKARQKGMDDKEVLTIIDFSKSSAKRRLVVYDVKNKKVLINTYVAHGVKSGGANATSFSNDVKSLKSSLGVFVTSEIYSGKHGESLRVQGLEPGFNDNAYRRDIVFHSAMYVGEDIAKSRGMVGRSWGCMAVNPNVIKPLIDTIKGKTIVVAYYPDNRWTKTSSFLI